MTEALCAKADEMPIGKLTLEISIPHSQSLKDRRQVVRSLKQRLRNRFNLAIAEVNEGALLWNRATLEVAIVSSSPDVIRRLLEKIARVAQGLASGFGADIDDAYAELIECEPDSLYDPLASLDVAGERTIDA